MQIAARKLFKVANEIISIANSVSNQPVKHVTMDASNSPIYSRLSLKLLTQCNSV